MSPKLPSYLTPTLWTCPHCGDFGEIIPLENSFTGEGPDGPKVYYPLEWGLPICSLCETLIEGDLTYDY